MEGPIIPGQAIENALGEATSKAANALVDGIGRTMGLLVAKRAARIEAEASELASDIRHKGELRRASEYETERRSQELTEIEHQAILERASSRLRYTFLAEQLKLEHLIEGATKRISSDPENDNARELNTEWLKRFFRCAQDVDEQTILDLFETALADASIAGRSIISPKALDILRYFDTYTLHLFLKISKILGLYGYCNSYIFSSSPIFGCDTDNTEVLEELDLIKTIKTPYTTIRIGSFSLNFSYTAGSNQSFDCIKLTQAGKEILKLVDKEIFSLVDYNGESNKLDKYWKCQEKYISEANLKSLTYSILSHIVGTVPFEIRIRQEVIGESDREYYALNTSRMEKEEKFDIRNQCKIIYPCFGEIFLQAVLDTSDDFDETILPVLIENQDL